MWKTAEGSTGRLVQLCLAYFFFYVIFGVATKCFTGSTAVIAPKMNDMEFLVWSTLGGSLVCLFVVFTAGWYRAKTGRFIQAGPLRLPAEYAYIIPSGVCTAIVIPTTTLMYMILKSVMVAMVIMRASVIVISRLVDEAQIRQGILRKTVYREENVAVAFAIAAAGTQILLAKSSDFDFLRNAAAMSVLSCYILAYMFRIYIMNYYKNTRPRGAPLDNKWFFSIEQIAASGAMLLATAVLFSVGGGQGAAFAGLDAAAQAQADWKLRSVVLFHDAFAQVHARWFPAVLAGSVYGMVAFFSVFIFMFKGRTATFAGLVNRLTSLVAGTTATLLSYFIFGGRFPSRADWASLGLILVAVGFLSVAEKRRTAELAAAKEIEAGPKPA
ncbi:MAG: hypothetical protein HY927_05095 [Elusimicrobia bacterium]|nr:hypothetical protein [Elusimicrobiota bacterium]